MADVDPEDYGTEDTTVHEKYIEEKKKARKRNVKHISKAITAHILGGYAYERLLKSDSEILWPPRMLEIIQYINDKYIRKTLFTELTIPMIELCLNLPIQLDVVVNGHVIDLNDKKTLIIFRDKCFVNAVTIIMDLLASGFLSESELRMDKKIIEDIKLRS